LPKDIGDIIQFWCIAAGNKVGEFGMESQPLIMPYFIGGTDPKAM
jgi:hypothetical protein